MIRWIRSLAETVAAVEQVGVSADVERSLLTESTDLLEKTRDALGVLTELTRQAEQMEEGRELAVFYHDRVMEAMEALRAPVDRLEMIVDKDLWPVPSYGDLLFEL